MLNIIMVRVSWYYYFKGGAGWGEGSAEGRDGIEIEGCGWCCFIKKYKF